LWVILGFVVQILNDFLELTDLLSDYLLSHSITNTISEDYEVLGEFSIVALSKQANCFFYALLHLVLDNFLVLLLDNVIRVVLGKFFVGSSRETNHGLLTSMTYIDTNEHGQGVQCLGHLQVVQITTNLAVDLFQDI